MKDKGVIPYGPFFYKVTGILDEDECLALKLRAVRLKKIMHLCDKEGISTPDEVFTFFREHPNPDTNRMEVDPPNNVSEWVEFSNNETLMVHVSQIPKNIKTIKIVQITP